MPIPTPPSRFYFRPLPRTRGRRSAEGLDADSYAALNDDFISLRDQIESVIATAEFDGKNLIERGFQSRRSQHHGRQHNHGFGPANSTGQAGPWRH